MRLEKSVKIMTPEWNEVRRQMPYAIPDDMLSMQYRDPTMPLCVHCCLGDHVTSL